MKIIKSMVTDFFNDDCLSMAENIAFCALLALIPISMVMVSIAGYFLGSSEGALANIMDIAIDVLPVGREEFIANLQSILDQRSTFSFFGIVFLIFIATLLVSSVEKAMNTIFKSHSKRNFFHSRLLGIALIFWITLLFSLPTMVGILEGLLQKFGFHFPLGWFVSGKAYFFLVAFLAYLMTIVVIPNKKVYLRYASFGGILFAVGIVAARYVFQWYMAFAIQRYNIIYGSLAAVVIMVLWIYYLSLLLLASAEIVSVLQDQRCFHFERCKEKKEKGEG